jgi:hypothetical protein
MKNFSFPLKTTARVVIIWKPPKRCRIEKITRCRVFWVVSVIAIDTLYLGSIAVFSIYYKLQNICYLCSL